MDGRYSTRKKRHSARRWKYRRSLTAHAIFVLALLELRKPERPSAFWCGKGKRRRKAKPKLKVYVAADGVMRLGRRSIALSASAS